MTFINPRVVYRFIEKIYLYISSSLDYVTRRLVLASEPDGTLGRLHHQTYDKARDSVETSSDVVKRSLSSIAADAQGGALLPLVPFELSPLGRSLVNKAAITANG